MYEDENLLNQVNSQSGERIHHRSPTQPLPAPPREENPRGNAYVYDVPPQRYPPPSPEGEYQVPGSVYQSPSSLPLNPGANISANWDTFESDENLTSIYSAPSSLPVRPSESSSLSSSSTNPAESQSDLDNQLSEPSASIPNPESGASCEVSSPAPSSAINNTNTAAGASEESSQQPVTMATAGPASRRRLDLNFFPGSTVVDLVEERSAASPSQEEEGEIYAPLWNEGGATSPNIPAIPPPLRKKNTRSQSVPNEIPAIPDRRKSRTLSVVSGQGRPAGEASLPEEPVLSGARMPGQPSRDPSIRVPVSGLPEDDDIPQQRAPPVPKPRAMSVDSSGPSRVPPRSPRSPDSGTYQVPVSQQLRSPGSPNSSTYQVPPSQTRQTAQSSTYEVPRPSRNTSSSSSGGVENYQVPHSPSMPVTPVTPNTPYSPSSTPQSQMGLPPAYTQVSRGRSMSVATPPTPMSPLNPPVYPQQTPGSGRSLSVGAIYLGANSNPPPEVSTERNTRG